MKPDLENNILLKEVKDKMTQENEHDQHTVKSQVCG